MGNYCQSVRSQQTSPEAGLELSTILRSISVVYNNIKAYKQCTYAQMDN